MFEPGSVENIIAIQSQEDLSMFSISPTLVKALIPVGKAMMIGRSRSNIIINSFKAFSMVFKGFSYFIPAATIAKF